MAEKKESVEAAVRTIRRVMRKKYPAEGGDLASGGHDGVVRQDRSVPQQHVECLRY